MSQELIKSVESAFGRDKPLSVRVGDTITVHQRIVEGEKERIQPFTGVVISRTGRGSRGSFTVRRIVNNEGVERVFPIDSPKVVGVEVVRSGKVRRSKLYYLRDRVGKARRLRDRRIASSKPRADELTEATEPAETSSETSEE